MGKDKGYIKVSISRCKISNFLRLSHESPVNNNCNAVNAAVAPGADGNIVASEGFRVVTRSHQVSAKLLECFVLRKGLQTALFNKFVK